MAGILLSGPAGGAKSQLAVQLIKDATGPTITADFQSLVVAMLALRRGSDGRYPIRPEWILPLAEYTRAAMVVGAVNREIDVIFHQLGREPRKARFPAQEARPRFS